MQGRTDYQLEHPSQYSAYYDPSEPYRLGPGGIFVFGSNLAGRHGKGAALTAYERYGARKGVGVGFTGRSYGIPTKTGDLKILSLDQIKKHIDVFRGACETCEMDDLNCWFYVTPIGTGLAGYKDEEIAPLFEATPRCWFPEQWRPYLGDTPGMRLERQKCQQIQDTTP